MECASASALARNFKNRAAPARRSLKNESALAFRSSSFQLCSLHICPLISHLLEKRKTKSLKTVSMLCTTQYAPYCGETVREKKKNII